MRVYRVQIAKRGVVTLPAEVRKERHLQEGQLMTLLDLGGVCAGAEGIRNGSPDQSACRNVAEAGRKP